VAVIRSYQDIPWSPLAIIPESVPPNLSLPLNIGGIDASIHGRSGDLLVVQLKSAMHEKYRIKESLRSLGLKGVGSQALRSSSDDNVFGYIKKAKHLIAVVELYGVQWKSATRKLPASRMEYEIIEYGNNTRPGGLYRNSDGDYFNFISDRDGLRTSWSTNLGASACLAVALQEITPVVDVDGGHSILVLDRDTVTDSSLSTGDRSQFEEFVASLTQSEEGETQIVSAGTVLEMPTAEAIDAIRNSELNIAMANIGLGSARVTWRKPYARFIDSELELAEVGTYSRRPDFKALGSIARKTGAPRFFDNFEIKVQVRERGAPKRIKI
jgi:ribosomal protein L30/L7E/uncharacterized protein